MFIRYLTLPIALLALFAPALAAGAPTLIAHWEFEDGPSFLQDSSGNGYHFQMPDIEGVNTPTFSPDKPPSAAGGGSAEFGPDMTFTTQSFLETVTPLALAEYNWLRISYWMKVDTNQADRVLLEYSSNTNVQDTLGGIMHLLHPSGQPEGSMFSSYRTRIGPASRANALDLNSFGTLGEWHFVESEIDLTQEASVDRVKLWINGTLGETFRTFDDDDWAGFRDDVLYLGGRRGTADAAALFFSGRIDDLKIEAEKLITETPGDFNGDGNVDGADFVIWQTNFPNNTGEATLATGDANGDGNVDGADFVIWQTNFPFTASQGAQVVPEPPSARLLIVASVLLGCLTLRQGMRTGRFSLSWK